jgi:predicted dehydrogenase
MSSNAFNRRSFLKLIGASALAAPFVTRDLLAQSPNSVLRHACFGASGMAGADLNEIAKFKNVRIVAVADVDLSKTAEFKKRFPDAKVYQDWRQLLEKEEKNIDSVNVSTPDHMHAPIALSAMAMGKHAYVQKPLAHDLEEVRKMATLAARKKLVTQMGIQIHSAGVYRSAVQLLQEGVIGKIKAVHSWCPKSWGDPGPKPDKNDPVPEGFDWNGWLGVCQDRPFIGGGYYHPGTWRKRLDFGTGTFGDMGCHIFDPVFKGLGLGAPITVRSEGPAPNQWNWAIDSRIQYTVKGNNLTESDILPVTWYDGAQKPPDDVLALLEGDQRPDTGSIVIGTEGVLVIPHISRPLLYPDKKFADFKYPDVPSLDHWGSFVDACVGKGKTSAHFDYAGPLTEAVLLGGVASRFPQTTLKWDSAKLRFNEKAATAFVARKYRSGWLLKG